MPHGQWVAFEGYDTPHDCSKPVPRDRNPKTLPLFENPPPGKKKSGNYDDLGFPDISIPRQDSQAKNEPFADPAREVGSFPSSQQEKTAHEGAKQGHVVQKKTRSIPSGFWWIIIFLGIILLLVLIG
jgi:hypothetical protein